MTRLKHIHYQPIQLPANRLQKIGTRQLSSEIPKMEYRTTCKTKIHCYKLFQDILLRLYFKLPIGQPQFTTGLYSQANSLFTLTLEPLFQGPFYNRYGEGSQSADQVIEAAMKRQCLNLDLRDQRLLQSVSYELDVRDSRIMQKVQDLKDEVSEIKSELRRFRSLVDDPTKFARHVLLPREHTRISKREPDKIFD